MRRQTTAQSMYARREVQLISRSKLAVSSVKHSNCRVICGSALGTYEARHIAYSSSISLYSKTSYIDSRSHSRSICMPIFRKECESNA